MSVRKFYLKIAFTILFSLAGLELVGQSTQVLVKAGLNYSGYRREPDLDVGYQFGLGAKKYLGDLGWFFQPELTYSLEGNINKRLEMLYIPLVLGFDAHESFNFHLGFQYGFLLGTRNTYEESNLESGNPQFLFGTDFYSIPRSILGFRFSYGLSPIDKTITSSRPVNFALHYYFIIKR